MKRSNLAKVELYTLMIGLSTDLIEEATGSKLEKLDATLDARLERALTYNNVKELKEVHLRLDEMLQNLKHKSMYAWT